jgi:coenzyme F420-0:L-glutamate ligase / coenzyme F420-1:gamma-L-glutamate ligase
MTALEVLPVVGLPEVRPGDDLAALIAAAADLRDGDVVVVAQKVVSKAEGAFASLQPGEDVAAARRRLAVASARRVVVDTGATVVVETAHGLVCANGGIDASNVPEGRLLLLPEDPDASARRLRAGLGERTGRTVAVVISDTFGRPWRLGQTDVAIGAAGIAPVRDERGGVDREGRVLDVTEAAIADEVAGAADLVRRKGDGVPVVVVRGLDHAVDEVAGAAVLVRPAELDLFRRGRGALADALAALPVGEEASPAAAPPAAAPPAALLDRALAAAERLGAGRCGIAVLDPLHDRGGPPVRVLLTPLLGEDPAARVRGAVATGAAAGALVAALLDLDLAAVLREPAEGEVPGGGPLGAVVVVAGTAAPPDGAKPGGGAQR